MNRNGHRILVIGSSNIDLIMKMKRLPEKGETVTDCDFVQTFGGKGANQAVAAARAGGHVTFVSCVGADAFGQQMIANFRKDGVDTAHVITDQETASGTALIMIDEQGENIISVAPGANYKLNKTHINGISTLIERASCIVLQYEITEETLAHVLHMADQKRTTTIFNYAPAKPLPLEIIRKSSILIINETEAQMLTGIHEVSLHNVEMAAEHLHAAGMTAIIITLGINGSYVSSPDFKGLVPAFKVKAIDTTAAGDVFCGTLATRLTEGASLKEAVIFSSAASAISVTRLGAQPSAPKRHEIDHFLTNLSNH